MTTRFVFHIGPERTGSAYLQHRLAADRTVLRLRGVTYAGAEMHALIGEEGEGGALAGFFADREAQGDAIVLFSGITLHQLGEAGFTKLRRALGGRQAELVFYIRRWSERLGACWSHDVHEGASFTLPEYYMSFFGVQEESSLVDHAPLWALITGIFGREALRLVSYSNIADRGQDPYIHFVRICLGLKGFPLTESTGRNPPSHSPTMTELRRVLNEVGSRKAEGGAPVALPDLALPELQKLRGAIERNLDTIEFNDASGRFDVAYRRMSEFSDLLVGGVPPAGIFRRICTTHPYARQDYLAEPGMAEAVLALQNRQAAAAV